MLPALRPANGAPSQKARRWPWVAAGLIIIALGAAAYSQLWMARPPTVAVEIVALAPVTRVLAVNGRIAAVHSVDVRSLVTGSLTDLPVAEGALVQAGQILAQVDAQAQTAIVRQAAAGLDAALVAQQQATEAYDRAAALGSNVAKTVLDSTAYAARSAAQEVARLTAVFDQASIVLENHTIRAPIAGLILARDAEVGQIVSPSLPLLTIADLSDLVVEAIVDEAYATQIALNQKAVLQLAGETDTRPGHVSFVSTRVDVNTGGLVVKMAFENPVTAPVGLTVTSNIIVDQRDAALTLPRTALQSVGNGQGVLVLRDGVTHLRPVTVLDWPAARLIVTQGLAEGEVIIADATGLTDGQAVTVGQP